MAATPLAIAGPASGRPTSPMPPGARLAARHDLDLDLRHLVHAHDRVVVEVRFLDRAALDRDPLLERVADAENHRAFDLRGDVLRVHRDAGVDRAPHLVHLDLAGALVERHLRDLGDVAVPVVREERIGDAERPAVPLLAPARHLGDFLNDLVGIGVAQHRQPVLDRIFAGIGRELVDESLDGEHDVAGTDRAPEADIDAAIARGHSRAAGSGSGRSAGGRRSQQHRSRSSP